MSEHLVPPNPKSPPLLRLATARVSGTVGSLGFRGGRSVFLQNPVPSVWSRVVGRVVEGHLPLPRVTKNQSF